jgi:hypothetical protein
MAAAQLGLDELELKRIPFVRFSRMDRSKRVRDLDVLEQDAEMLVVLQLDLLADVERQVRAVHQTMRHIEKLRGVRSRVGPELSDTQRTDTLSTLDDEIVALEEHFAIEQECCSDMHDTIKKMRARLAEMRQRTSPSNNRSVDPSSESDAQS